MRKEYLVQYTFEGSEYMISVYADSWDDARARVPALATAEVIGEYTDDPPIYADNLCAGSISPTSSSIVQT